MAEWWQRRQPRPDGTQLCWAQGRGQGVKGTNSEYQQKESQRVLKWQAKQAYQWNHQPKLDFRDLVILVGPLVQTGWGLVPLVGPMVQPGWVGGGP